MSMVYSDLIMEHFRRPRNYGSLPSPDVAYEDVNPLCGDRIRIELKINDHKIEAARFKGDACAICIASASILTELVTGIAVDEAEVLSGETVLSALGDEIRPSRMQCALLPIEVMRAGFGKRNSRFVEGLFPS